MKDFICQNKQKIVCVGIGENFRVIKNGLEKNGITDYFVCDKKVSITDIEKRELSYADIEKMSDWDFIITSGRNCVEIYILLKKAGVCEEKIYTAKKLYREGVEYYDTDLEKVPLKYVYDLEIMKLYVYLNGGWKLNHLDVFITERCTLRCKYCCALVPYYDNPVDLTEEDIYEGLDNLLFSGCYIGTLCLMGGEPMMNQELMRKFLKRYKNCEQIAVFQTITNGTVVPEDKTIEVLKDVPNFYIIFSNYGKFSINQKKAVEKLHESNIVVAVEQSKDIKAEENTLWLDYGEVKKYGRSDDEVQAIYDHCLDAKHCTTLLKNELYICNRIAHGVNMGLIPRTIFRTAFDLSNKAVEGKNNKEIKNGCEQFLFADHFPYACDYCNRGAGILGKRAEQLER